ncbi:MAG: DUF362 domain-containing protein [Nitrospirae bacterium]|nr:DUF362 domain-containing protein [Nitrospirota bacterium]
MNRNKVAVTKCTSYNTAEVSSAIKDIFAAHGGVRALFKKGDKIAVKVNILKASHPDKAIITHPMIVYAVCKELVENGVNPVIVESPGTGTPYTPESLRSVYKTCGYFDLFKNLDVEFNYNTDYTNVKIPSGKVIKYLDIINPILSADGIINIAKGKTHGFTYLTGAVKNLFGTIPGMYKAGYHLKLKGIGNFSEMLVDIAHFIKPRLSLIDAVVCMEGNGPADGQPREVGHIIASDSPFAADYVFCDMVGLDYRKNPVLLKSEERGFLNRDNIIANGKYNRITDFIFPDTAVTMDGFVNPSFLFKTYKFLFKDMLTLKPVINRNCAGCGICKKSCPASAITLREGSAVIDYNKCIRCYCCHEMCNNRAVDFHRGIMYKISKKLLSKKPE